MSKLRSVRAVTFVLLASMAATGVAIGGDAEKVVVDAQVRWRPETDNKNFTGTGTSFQLLRTRIGAAFNHSAKTRAYVQLQDSRTMGVPNSGSLSNDTNLGVHQAYFEIDEFFAESLGLKAGRFEMNHGNQRLVGAVGWHNVGRRFDGAALNVTKETFKLELFQAKVIERLGTRPDRDRNLYGLRGILSGKGAEAAIYWDRDGQRKDIRDEDEDKNALNRFTLAVHSSRKLGEKADYVANAAYQTGTQVLAVTNKGGDEYDISAYLLTLEVGVKPNEKMRIRAGVDFASGDDGKDEKKLKTFDNLYYTGHKFRGRMDKFLGSNVEGLLDFYIGDSMKFNENWKAGGDLHYFQTATDYTFTDSKGNEKSTSELGVELDASIENTQMENVNLQLGGAVFFAGDDYANYYHSPALPTDKEKKTGMWGYFQVVVNLP